MIYELPKYDSVEYVQNLLLMIPAIDETQTISDEDITSQSSKEIISIVLEYARISSKFQHSQREDRLVDDILKMAESNNLLEFWLSEIDHILSHHQGFSDEDARESYKDQHAALCEYISQPSLSYIPQEYQLEVKLEQGLLSKLSPAQAAKNGITKILLKNHNHCNKNH
jgi:hypothetical protein